MIYIILVNWNGGDDTVRCLESLLRLTYSDFNIIICDNGSTDDSVEKIGAWARGDYSPEISQALWDKLSGQKQRPIELTVVDDVHLFNAKRTAINLVRIGKNLGFSGANNVGMKLALRDPKMQYVWLLNNDTVVEPSALDELVKRASTNRSIGICGSTLVYDSDAATIQGVGVKFNLITGRGLVFGKNVPLKELFQSEKLKRADIEQQLSYVIGASMLVSRKYLESVGLLSEDYFLYFEELDWIVRAKKQFELAWAPRSIVYHKEGGSIGSASRSRPSNTSIYYLTASHLVFTRKHFPYLLCFAFLRHLAILARFALKGDTIAIRVIFSALHEFLRTNVNRPPTEIAILARKR